MSLEGIYDIFINSESDVQGYFKLAIAGQDVQNEFPRIWLKGGITVLSNTNTNNQILYKNMKRFFSKYVKEITVGGSLVSTKFKAILIYNENSRRS